MSIFLLLMKRLFLKVISSTCGLQLSWVTFWSFWEFPQLTWSKHRITAANKGWSAVNYCQSLAFDCPYLSCNDHCDWWLSQKTSFCYLQKQLYADVLQNNCCLKCCDIHRKTSVLESLFNKTAGLTAWWPATLFQTHPKKDFNTSVFLKLLQNFSEQLFL